jgi:hypothetical protein
MMDFKLLTTPMAPNIKLHKILDLDLVYPSVYRKLIGSLLYQVNTKPYICFPVNTLSQYMVHLR